MQDSTSSVDPSDLSMKRNGKLMSILGTVGVFMYAGPVYGVIGTIIAMINLFAEIGESGKVDASVLASEISIALLTTFYGILLSVPGVIVLLVIHHKRLLQKNWFYTWSLGLSIAWLFLFPLGTIIGSYMVYTFGKSRAFYGANKTK